MTPETALAWIDDRLAEEAKATPGPWESIVYEGDDPFIMAVDASTGEGRSYVGSFDFQDENPHADAALIVSARNGWRAALSTWSATLDRHSETATGTCWNCSTLAGNSFLYPCPDVRAVLEAVESLAEVPE